MSDPGSNPPARENLFNDPFSAGFLSVYILVFRLSRWRGFTRNLSAVFGVSLVLTFLLMLIVLWTEVGVGQRLVSQYKLFAVPIEALAWAFSYQVLIRQKHGPRFQERFSELPRRERIIVRLIGLTVIVGVAVLLYASRQVFQQTFHIEPKA